MKKWLWIITELLLLVQSLAFLPLGPRLNAIALTTARTGPSTATKCPTALSWRGVRRRRKPVTALSATPSSSSSSSSSSRGRASPGGAPQGPTEREDLSLGAPRYRPLSGRFITKGGVQISCQVDDVQEPMVAVNKLINSLDSHEGVVLASSYEFPGRYARWTLGFIDPPLKLEARARSFSITALNDRGLVLLEAIHAALSTPGMDATSTGSWSLKREGNRLEGEVPETDEYFPEEERSKQPSVFSVIRAIVDLFFEEGDPQLGLYGALGYDLTFQFEPIELKKDRPASQRDVVLYLPDEILVVDQDKRSAWRLQYDFMWGDKRTTGIPRGGQEIPFKQGAKLARDRDTPKGAYAESVDKAKEEFKVGNLFEVVLSQTFFRECGSRPSEVFERLRTINPSPYGFLMNLGQQEYLIGASPEMFVRCERTKAGLRVETCPISGTIARGSNALEDAARIKALLFNPKEESELTMCTDVDRNDKSRICEPGSVRVLGRRQIEMYSKLIHTVDHVEGYLREGFDALDAFLCHTWAVTVTGAPKTWAIQFIEDMEATARAWYGGAVGLVAFDGSLNTGLTLRTIRVNDGIAEVRAGATLLYDSEPAAEEAETELKASAMLDALALKSMPNPAQVPVVPPALDGHRKRVLLIDHEDSFVHTLANYLRQTGAEVITVRSGPNALAMLTGKTTQPLPDLVVLSPGPGCPADFGLSSSLAACMEHRIPVFGVCLGLQGMVEHFGGDLDVLSYPMHGKSSHISLVGDSKYGIFEGLPKRFEVARYHSLHGRRGTFPECLRITAVTDDDVVMAMEHKDLPLAAVQFHPESILTNPSHGLRILANALNHLVYQHQPASA